MIIIKQNNITIPRGISPSFVTTDHDISLQKKSVTITKNGVSTITPDPSYDALSSVKVTTDIHPTPKLQNIVKTYVENGNYSLTPGTSYDGIGNVSITIDVPEKVINLQDKNISITENGDYDVSKDSSFDGIDTVSISVNVPEKILNLQDKNENIVSNGDYRYTPDDSFDGLKSVNVHVEVPEKKIILQNKDITENGSVTYDEGFDGLGVVNVNVPIPEYKSQTKDVSYVNNGSFTLKPDIDFDGISQANINVNVPIPEYKSQTKDVSYDKNGSFTLKPDASYDGISQANITVNVPEKVYKTQEKTAVPTTSEQRIIPDSSFDALSAVNISAVDSTIDSNIIPENIKKGISILGVEGTNEPHVFPMGTVLAQDILSDEPAPQNLVYNAAERDIDGYSNVEIERIAQERITKTITANGTITIKPSTDYDVIKDANITVNVPSKDPTLQEKTIDASSLYNETKDIITETITPDNDFDGLSKVTYTRLNLAKNRTTAVGVLPDKSGSYVFFKPEKGFDGFLNFGFRINYQEPTVDPSTSQQLIEPSTGYACFKNVTVNPVDKIPLRYIECDGNTLFKLISTNDTLNLLNSYTCDIQCSFTQAVSITKSKPTLLNFVNNTGSSYESEVMVIFGQYSPGGKMLETYVRGEDKNIVIDNDYYYYTFGDETCIDVQIHNSVDSSTASNKLVVSDISGATGSNINTTLPNELIAFGGYNSSGNLECTSSPGYRIHRIILHRDQIAAQPDKTRTYYEFIPVLHDGKPCFFETSTKTYHYNLGTGTPKYELL